VINAWSIHGHAIVSENHRIADSAGMTPPALRNEADWRRFQAALDQAAVTVLGRLGHDANPNLKRRNRLVLSSSASGVERRPDALWWNPATASVDEALAAAAPDGGIVAVPGGRRVFDLFLDIGYDAFDLARVRGLVIPGGVPIFSAVKAGIHRPEDLLAAHGLVLHSEEELDRAAGVGLARWRRP
jgi:hypothetical protein